MYVNDVPKRLYSWHFNPNFLDFISNVPFLIMFQYFLFSLYSSPCSMQISTYGYCRITFRKSECRYQRHNYLDSFFHFIGFFILMRFHILFLVPFSALSLMQFSNHFKCNSIFSNSWNLIIWIFEWYFIFQHGIILHFYLLSKRIL